MVLKGYCLFLLFQRGTFPVPKNSLKRMPQSFKIITLGCKVNQYESAHLKEALVQGGLKESRDGERADTAIINTCIVTKRAAHQSRQAIRKAVRENPGGVVAAIGCYAQVFPEELVAIPGVGLIAGNSLKREVPALLMNAEASGHRAVALERFEPGMPFEYLPIKRLSDRSRAYLKVQDGCESYCSYCIVPYARGPLRSLSLSKVLSQCETFAQEGYGEIVLTGIHLGRYGADLEEETTLTTLLLAIGRERFPLRVRLSSLEPGEIHGDIIELAGIGNRLCPHFHIPLQSGDDHILGKMNRNYTGREFASLVEDIKAKIPEAAIGVDVMAGFPGEDHRAYSNTLSLIEDLPISYLHVFPFSRRRGTPANTFDGQNDSVTIKERARELRALGQSKRHAFYRDCLNKAFEVLVEGKALPDEKMLKGTSDNYLPVVFAPAHKSRGGLVSVYMEKIRDNTVIGNEVRNHGPARA